MAKFAQTVITPTAGTTVNRAGGEAFSQSAERELVHILLTSFLKNGAYRSGDDTLARLQQLFAEVDPKFAAKAAIYARNEFGMRSISHALAGEIAHRVKGEQWTKDFFHQIVRRPDDMMEILAYIHGTYKKYEPNSLKKGFGAALAGMDEYQLGKYRGEGKDMSLVDVVNLVHPPHTEPISKLVNGTLESPDTWEVLLTQAGQRGNTPEEKAALKAEAWTELITTRKLGYFALLRNLRNIAQQAPDALDAALEMLVDEELIRKSLVLPFRFLTAYKQFEGLGTKGGYGYNWYGRQAVIADVPENLKRKIIVALSKAIDISLANVPEMDGDTLVVVDASGSMHGGGQTETPIEIASFFAAALLKANNADLMLFEGDAQYVTFNPTDSTVSIARHIYDAAHGGATNFSAPFERATAKYDRIIILSDMQGWVESRYYRTSSPVPALRAYEEKFEVTPNVYSFDLTGYGSMMLPHDRVFELAGFSDKVFDLMRVIEEGEDSLIRVIDESVNL